jgi:hypothetical protein
MPDVNPNAQRTRWLSQLRSAVRAGDPRNIYRLYMDVGGAAADRMVQAAAWTDKQVGDAATTVIKALAMNRAAKRAYDEELAKLTPDEVEQLRSTWSGRFAQVGQNLQIAIGKLDGIMDRVHYSSGRNQRYLAQVREGLAPYRNPLRWGEATTGAAAAGLGLSVGAWAVLAVVALLAITAMVVALASMFGDARDAAHGIRMSRADVQIESEVRADMGIPLGAPMTAEARAEVERRQALWRKNNPPPKPSGVNDLAENLRKALPWAFGIAALGVGTKVYLDFKGGGTTQIVMPSFGGER